MARRIFKRIGIRRDRNLSDLSNTTEALNNLLNSLTDNQSTFISEDLNAIRGSFSIGFSNDQYKEIINSEEKITTKGGLSSPFLPRITYQNKLDNFKLFAGEPRLFGGNGLTARYYDPSNVNVNSVDIFSGTPFKVDNFWEAGNFSYSGKITAESIDVNGGVEWEGFFIPINTGTHIFTINSSACFTFDFEAEGYVSGIGTYTEISRIGISSTFQGSGGASTINLVSPANVKYVGIGQTVSGTGVPNGTTVTIVNRSTGAIGLSNPLTSGGTRDITFAKTVGENTGITYISYTLIQYRPYRVRFRYFIPQGISADSVPRYINFDLRQPRATDVRDLRYNYLYSLDYDFSDQALGNFNSFLNNSILSGGGTLGGTTNLSDYVAVETNKKIDIKYVPKTSVSQVIRSSVSGSITSETSVLSLSGLDTTNIEVGNYVFGNGIPIGTRVSEIIVNQSVILDQNATPPGGSGTYTFVEHRGFVKRITGTTNSGTVTVTSGDTSSLTKDMIVIGTGLESYTKIVTIPTNTSFTVSPSQSAASTILYLYESKGLINNGLTSYCVPAETKCAIVTQDTPTGSVSLTVNDSTGIGIGWIVQGPQFTVGTAVTAIPNPTTIDINNPTILGFNAGSNFTATRVSGDRTICCPPTDTSPPFNPTLEGLDTISTGPTPASSLRIESGNLKFDSLVGIVSESNITELPSSLTTEVSGSIISIQTPGGLFGILCV
jgi:hypothetical protein